MRFIVSLLLITIASPGVARGDQADDLISEGVALRRQGKDEAAMAKFRRSYALRPTARALGQIGLAEQALGKWVDADRDLQRALATTDDAWIERNRAFLENARTVVATHVGDLEVIGPAGAELIVDNVRAAKLPLDEPLRVPTGRFEIEVRLAGHTSVFRTVNVLGHSLTREEVVLLPTPKPVVDLDTHPAPIAPLDVHVHPAKPPLYKRWWFWTATIGGVAIAATAISLGVIYGQPPEPVYRVGQ